jgi:myo-inositol catabolism protein IolC
MKASAIIKPGKRSLRRHHLERIKHNMAVEYHTDDAREIGLLANTRTLYSRKKCRKSRQELLAELIND